MTSLELAKKAIDLSKQVLADAEVSSNPNGLYYRRLKAEINAFVMVLNRRRYIAFSLNEPLPMGFYKFVKGMQFQKTSVETANQVFGKVERKLYELYELPEKYLSDEFKEVGL